MTAVKGITLISVGILNVLHAFFHIFQFIQSIFLTINSINSHKDSWIHDVLESPYMAIVWAVIGLLTLLIGWRDFKHHKHHKD